MKKNIKQIRYYGDGSPQNTPNVSEINLKSGDIFTNYTPITKLGIQTAPGVKFSLNGSIEYITINNTGIFELDLEDQVQITALRFYSGSFSLIKKSGLLIDLVYESEED